MEQEMLFSVTDPCGRTLVDPMMLTFTDIFWIKQTFICEVQWGQLVLY